MTFHVATRLTRQTMLLTKQRGFIQNLIIPGVILLGIVLGAFALMSSSSNGGGEKEQASVYAAQILAQGVVLKEGIQRANGDGIPVATIAGDLQANLVTAGYVTGTLPAAPAGSQSTATAWSLSSGAIALTDGQATPADLGTSAKDDVLLLTNVTRDVCIRINNKLYGETIVKANDAAIGTTATATAIAAPNITSSNATQLKVGTPEGCVPGAAASTYTYYKMIKAV